MQLATIAALAISSASFAFYGMGCLISEQMVPEFERYRLGKFRTITGVLQVAASIGLIAGYFYRPLLLVSAGGLATMMFLAVLVRLRIRDPLYMAIPALVLGGINAFIVWSTLAVPA